MATYANAKFSTQAGRSRRSEREIVEAVREYGELLNLRAHEHLGHMASASRTRICERFELAFANARRFLRIARADLAYLILRSTEDHLAIEPSRRFLVWANHASTTMWLVAKERGVEAGRSLPPQALRPPIADGVYRAVLSAQEHRHQRSCDLMQLQFLVAAISIRSADR